MDDMALLREYADRDSEKAFETLVSRRLGFVYSAALRQVRDPGLAEEVAQAVFVILARKAGRISERTILTGWLFKTTRFTALAQQRATARRRQHELEMPTEAIVPPSASEAAWDQLSPMLDEALAGLGEADREVVLLRFFENCSFAEVGSRLNIGEEAARKRVARALGKLRKCFSRRGAGLTTAIIAAVISANSVQAAPAALAKSITVAAVAKGGVAAGSASTLAQGALKLMAWAKVKMATGFFGSALLVVGASSLVIWGSHGREREARKTLDDLFRRYASLASYASTGTTVENIGDRTLTAPFAMRLGRPDRYFIQYEQHGPYTTNKAVLWSDGTGDYFANELAKQTSRSPFNGPSHNLDMVLDVSGGVTAVVPALFFGIEEPDAQDALGQLVQPAAWRSASIAMEADETVAGTVCHVVSCDTKMGKLWFWIGTQDGLVRQTRERLSFHLPAATDQEVSNLLAGVPGRPPLSIAEMKRRIDAGRKQATVTGKSVTVVFSQDQRTSGLKSMTIEPPGWRDYTQTHERIAVNQAFSSGDFTR